MWALALACAFLPALAGDFSVTPIKVELGGGTLSETITVTNHAADKLRISVKLMEWTQDAKGEDVYKESSDLVYFPRQLEVEPQGKRLVRVGVKGQAGVVERAYRLFLEEEPDAAAAAARSQVALYFRFGVPVFLPPVAPKPQPEVMEPTLRAGKLALQVRNPGNQHFRLNKVTISDGASYTQELNGWYSLAGTERTYSADIPRDACRKATVLNVLLEGEGIRIERKLNVDPASCA